MNRERLLILLLMWFGSNSVFGESLYVYAPTNVRAIFVQKQMLSACPEVDITVFGRSSSFHKQVDFDPPEAILSLPVVVDSIKPYLPTIQGVNNGLESEPAVLLSLDQKVDLKRLDSISVGVVDILGRKPMQQYINDIFGVKVKIERVIKIEDLVPLLMLGMADAIFISKSEARRQKEKFDLTLVETPLEIELGLTMGAVQTQDKNMSHIVEQCVQRFDAGINTILGIEKWRVL